VKVQRLHHSYPNQQIAVLRDLRFQVYPREIVAVIGPSGAGKTTLLRILAGLLPCGDGTVLVNQQAPSRMRGDIGLVFQHYPLFPWLDVEENIAFGLRMKNTPAREIESKVTRLMELTGLTEHRYKSARQLSGGQKQRVALARTLALKPRLLLLDEPFGALDPLTKQQVHESLVELHAEFQPATVLVTHDIEDALLLSDRILVLGRTPATITANIANPFPKPRDAELKTTPEFQELRQKIARMLSA
jgi:NitT/TauT family transport system ATP-binding protein